MKLLKQSFLSFCILFFGITLFAFSQQTGTIQGTVIGTETNEPLAGVNVSIENTNRGTATKADGSFELNNVSTGSKKLIFSFVGFKQLTKSVTVNAGQTTTLEVSLQPRAILMEGIQVTALRPDQIAESSLKQSDVKEANPRDSGELLRNVSGVDAVRRGPVGLDPVVRGLRETEVGTYLDGTRIFPGGPARMDSPLSHLDPTAIETIEVVKGPYALNWGAGNMSAIRVETQTLNTISTAFGGSISSGYDSNLNAFEEAVSLQGSSGKWGYWIHGAWREGNDYETGNGTNVPGDFLSREIRTKLGYSITSNSYLEASFGYQNQDDLDYPGRLLDADYFDTYNSSLSWKWNPDNSLFSLIKANAYINNVNHGMDNDEKPTAQPNPNRTPPFALDVTIDTRAHVKGGMFAVEMDPSSALNIETGIDVYSANRDATRIIDRRNQGMKPPAFPLVDLMWPDATITDAGIYGKANYRFTESFSVTGTLRLDFVSADTDTISQFFKDNVSTDLKENETNFNASATASYIPFDNWSIGIGAGSVVRTADVNERYSDRIPASKSQTSAEFVGNPALEPERSTQADLWIDAQYTRFSISANVFVRHMENYITLSPTNLQKRLPLSPNTVFQYVNGEADYWGFEVSSAYRLIPSLSFNAGISYLWGKETTLQEPALGVPPFSIDTGLRYQSTGSPWFAETTLHWTSEQDRVAITRGETPTDSYLTLDLQAGVTLLQQLSIQAGIENITDKTYVNHLNAKNPFTAQPIAEPGRVFHVDLSFKF
ncbi:MAG: TonB-dependent receptor [Balneolaceae bacterium]|nr:TonB-dependent receptor [Balneolaceae bacterium]